MKVLFTNQMMNFQAISQQGSLHHINKIQISTFQQEKDIKLFDWSKRWLKGDQYAYILQNIDEYCNKFGLEKFQYKSHPDSIYKNPINGLIYFVKGKSVGSDFGFPRVSTKKKYRWKKMNFTTDLPKKKPFVTYVVASAMKANVVGAQSELPDYRMHAVIPYHLPNKKNNSDNEYILCHVRQVENRKNGQQEQLRLETCFVGAYPDFCKLFLYLHNIESKTCQK